jgi:Holliday junction resolvase RusA-like endonuclease
MKIFQRKPSKYFQDTFQELTKKSVEKSIITIRDRVKLSLKKKETNKIKETMAVIKKIIKEDIEAMYKFFALLLLKEIMESKDNYVVDYFIKKMSDRLVKIAKYREKKGETIQVRGMTCLNE